MQEKSKPSGGLAEFLRWEKDCLKVKQATWGCLSQRRYFFLMGYSKNYNVLGGYMYYNSIPLFFCIVSKYTKFTKALIVFW